MRFNVCHMRNYQQYCETEDCVDVVKNVAPEGIEAAIKKLFGHSWISDHDWIRIELENENQAFLQYLEEKDSQAEGSSSPAPQLIGPDALPVVSREEFLENWQRTIDRMEGSSSPASEPQEG